MMCVLDDEDPIKKCVYVCPSVCVCACACVCLCVYDSIACNTTLHACVCIHVCDSVIIIIIMYGSM